MSKQQAKLGLICVALLWGISYFLDQLAINAGMHSSMINAWRGGLCALTGLVIFHRQLKHLTAYDLRVGIISGIISFLGYYFQTDALRYTTPAKNAFITSLYVIIAPFIIWAIWRERPQRKEWLAMLIAIFGTAFISGLSLTDLHLQSGDLLSLIGAIFWAGQLIVFGRYAGKASSPWVVITLIGLVEFFVGTICTCLFERATFHQIDWLAAIIPLAILAIGITFIAQGLQIISQRQVDPTTAGLILITESLFAGLFSVLFGFDKLTSHLIIGGSLLILANIVMQLDLVHLRKIKH